MAVTIPNENFVTDAYEVDEFTQGEPSPFSPYVPDVEEIWQSRVEDSKEVRFPKPEIETVDPDWEDYTNSLSGFRSFEVDPDVSWQPNDSAALYDYDEDARQLPWNIEQNDEGKKIRDARTKAAAIVSLLDITNNTQLNSAIYLMVDFFEHYKHSSTFRAIEKLAEDGLDLETLRAMVSLRRLWTQRTDWWLRRRNGNIGPSGNVCTWRLAHKICLARWQFSPELMVDDDWLDEWLSLPSQVPGYFSFTEFIIEKIQSLDAETMNFGFRMGEQCFSNGAGDEYDWYRRISDPSGIISQSFHILTPYERRSHVIGPTGPTATQGHVGKKG